MTSFVKTHGLGLINLNDVTGVINGPLRVCGSALERFQDGISEQLDQLESRFSDFVTRDSLGTAMKRNR